MTAHIQQRRWYDEDPILSMAMKTLEKSEDTEQLQIAMHIIKIVNEHNIDPTTADLLGEDTESADMNTHNSRWYDFDRTLQASIEALRYCNTETQKIISRDIVKLLKNN